MSQETYSQKILIVEDELPMLQALVDNLQAAGFSHIIQVRDGQEGLALALSESPDLILLDIVLPKMDGMTMLKKLREDPKGKDIKVILLTNLIANEPIMNTVITTEPSYYLVKTEHSVGDVINKVKNTLNIQD